MATNKHADHIMPAQFSEYILLHWGSSQRRWSLVALGWMIVGLTVWARWRHNHHHNHRRHRHRQHHDQCGSSEETEEAEATEPETTFLLLASSLLAAPRTWTSSPQTESPRWAEWRLQVQVNRLTQTIKLSTFIRPVLKRKVSHLLRWPQVGGKLKTQEITVYGHWWKQAKLLFYIAKYLDHDNQQDWVTTVIMINTVFSKIETIWKWAKKDNLVWWLHRSRKWNTRSRHL